MAQGTRIDNDLVIDGNLDLTGLLSLGESLTTGTDRTIQAIGTEADIHINLLSKGLGLLKTRADYDLDIASDEDIINYRYAKEHLAGVLTSSLLQAPTVTEDMYSVVWDETNGEYSLVDLGGGTNAVNGLYRDVNDIKLGGPLIEITEITGAFPLSFGTTGDKITEFKVYASDLLNISGIGTTQLLTSGTNTISLIGGSVSSSFVINDDGAPFVVDLQAGAAKRGLRAGADYSAMAQATDYIQKGYVDTHLVAKTISSVLGTPTVTQHGYSITWDNTNTRFTLNPLLGVATFLNLTDTPSTYVGQATKVVRVNAGETGLEFTTGSGGVTNFTDLGDVPSVYTGEGLKFVRVKATEDGLEFSTVSVSSGHTIQNSGTPLTTRTNLNFAGALQAIDNSGADSSDISIITNSISDSLIRQSVGLSIIGRSANTTGNVADITGSANQLLRVSGTTLGFGTIGDAYISDLAWSKITSTPTTLAGYGITDAVTNSLAGLSVLGRASNSSGTMAAITGTDGQLLRVTGTTLSFGNDDLNALTFKANQGIDVTATGGSDVLNIGTTNANVINYGNSSTTHNFLGVAIYELQVNSYVTDKLITLNAGGAVASGTGTGFEIEENAIITGYLKTNGTRDGYSFKTPAISGVADISLASLTGNHTYIIPDAAGTFAVSASGNIALSAVGNITFTGDLPFSNLTQGSAHSVLGVTGNATADVASIQSGAAYNVMVANSTNTGVSFSTIDLSQAGAVGSSILGIANGGSGTSTIFTLGSVVFAGASGVYSQNNASFFWDDSNTILYVGSNSGAFTNSRIDVGGSVNAYLQNNIMNASSGTSASSDWIATADTGTDSTNYVDIGINSSTYSDAAYTIGGALSSYVYANGGTLTIGTQSAQALIFFTGGTLAANERFRFSSTGVITATQNIGGSSYTGTWTATANNQSHYNFIGTLTARATNADKLYGYRFTSALTSAASSQNLIAVDISPTLTDANSGTVVALNVTGSMTINDSTMATISNAIERTDTTLYIKGTSTGATKHSLYIVVGSTPRLDFNGDGYMIFAGATGAPQIFATNNVPAGIIDRQGGVSGVGLAIDGSGGAASTTTTALTVGYRSIITSTATITRKGLGITSNFAPTSGAAAFVGLEIYPIYNQTSSASGAMTGLRYNPTLTGVLGAHYAIITGSGLHGFGTLTPTYQVHITGTAANQNLFLVEEDGGTNILEIIEAGGANKIGFFAAAPVVQQAGLTTITHTAPGTPDYAFQDLINVAGYGFATKDEGNTLLSVVKAMHDAMKNYGLLT